MVAAANSFSVADRKCVVSSCSSYVLLRFGDSCRFNQQAKGASLATLPLWNKWYLKAFWINIWLGH